MKVGLNGSGVTLSASIMVKWKITLKILKTLDFLSLNVQSFAKLKETNLGDEIHPFVH